MAFPHTHLLLTVEGDAWTSLETWQFGLHFDIPTVPTALTAIDTAINAWFTSANIGVNKNVRYLGFKLALIAPDGHYPPGHAPTVFTRTVPAIGVGVDSQIPQASLVISLRTALPRGRGHAGRIYPPPQVHPVGADGRVAASSLNTSLTTWKSFFDSLITAVGGRLVVASSLASTFQPVTTIRAGRVYDTQRRRRSSLPEEYSTTTIANP